MHIQYIKNDRFSGFMTIGEEGDLNAFKARKIKFSYIFQNLRTTRDEICQKLNLNIAEMELSMGMSADYEQAVSKKILKK